MARLPYMTKNPNDPERRWDNLRSWIRTLSMIVTCNGMGEPTPPFGRTPSHEIDAECDAWVRKLVKQDTVGQKDMPSAKLAPWLWARLLVAGEHIYDMIQIHALPPNKPGVQEALEDLLVNQWHQELHKHWVRFSYDGEKLNRDNEMVLFRPMRDHWMTAQNTDEDDMMAVTWKNVNFAADLLAVALCQRVKMKLPFGQLPSPEIDARCDKWFSKFFPSDDPEKMVEKCPKTLAPWLAARMVTAMGITLANLESNPNPPQHLSVYCVLEELVITRWNSTMKQLWLGVYLKEDGKIGFRGDPTMDHLQSKGIFFSMN